MSLRIPMGEQSLDSKGQASRAGDEENGMVGGMEDLAERKSEEGLASRSTLPVSQDQSSAMRVGNLPT
jgi:hypothetical protein